MNKFWCHYDLPILLYGAELNTIKPGTRKRLVLEADCPASSWCSHKTQVVMRTTQTCKIFLGALHAAGGNYIASIFTVSAGDFEDKPVNFDTIYDSVASEPCAEILFSSAVIHVCGDGLPVVDQIIVQEAIPTCLCLVKNNRVSFYMKMLSSRYWQRSNCR